MRQGPLIKHVNYITPDIRDVIFFEEKPETAFNPECYTLCETEHPCNPDFKLVYIGPVQNDKRRLYYAADRKEQWKYNYTFTDTAASGGPKYSSYQRLCVIPRCEFNPDSVDPGDSPGDTDPDADLNLDCDGNPIFPSSDYVLSSKSMTRSNIKELDACYVFVVKTYIKLCDITSYSWDSELEEMVETVTTICPKSDNPQPSGIDPDGTVTTVTDLNCSWAAKVKTKIIDTDKVKSYQDYVDFRWPAVLDSVEFMVWNRIDGQQFIYPRPIWKRRAVTVPTRVVITRTYHTEEQDLASDFPIPVTMLPNSINYVCPSFRVNLPACLHGNVGFVCDYGNNNPVWNFTTGSARTFPETELSDCTAAPDWPLSMVVSVKQRPYKGGYVVDVVEIFNPSTC